MALIQGGGGTRPIKATPLSKAPAVKRRKKDEQRQVLPTQQPISARGFGIPSFVPRDPESHGLAITRSYFEKTGKLINPEKSAALVQATLADESFQTEEDFLSLFDWINPEKHVELVEDDVELHTHVKSSVERAFNNDREREPAVARKAKPEELRKRLEEQRERQFQRADELQQEPAPTDEAQLESQRMDVWRGVPESQRFEWSRIITTGGPEELYDVGFGPQSRRWFDKNITPNEALPDLNVIRRLQKRVFGKPIEKLDLSDQYKVGALAMELYRAYGGDFGNHYGKLDKVVWDEHFNDYLARYITESALPFAVLIPADESDKGRKALRDKAMGILEYASGGRIKPDDDIYHVLQALGIRQPESGKPVSEAYRDAFYAMFSRTRPGHWGEAPTALVYAAYFGDQYVPESLQDVVGEMHKEFDEPVEIAHQAMLSAIGTVTETLKEHPEYVAQDVYEKQKPLEYTETIVPIKGSSDALRYTALAIALTAKSGFTDRDWHEVFDEHWDAVRRDLTRSSVGGKGYKVGGSHSAEVEFERWKTRAIMDVIAPTYKLKEVSVWDSLEIVYGAGLLALYVAQKKTNDAIFGRKTTPDEFAPKAAKPGGEYDIMTRFREYATWSDDDIDFFDMFTATLDAASQVTHPAASLIIDQTFGADPEKHKTITFLTEMAAETGIDLILGAGMGKMVDVGRGVAAKVAAKTAEKEGRKIAVEGVRMGGKKVLGEVFVSRASKKALDAIDEEMRALREAVPKAATKAERRNIGKRIMQLQEEKDAIISRPLWYDTIAMRLARSEQDPLVVRWLLGIDERGLGLARKGGKVAVDDVAKAKEARIIAHNIERIAASRDEAEITRRLSRMQIYGVKVDPTQFVSTNNRFMMLDWGAYDFLQWNPFTVAIESGVRHSDALDAPLRIVVPLMRSTRLGMPKVTKEVTERMSWYAREFTRVLDGPWTETQLYRQRLFQQLLDEIKGNLAGQAVTKSQLRQLKLVNFLSRGGLKLKNIKTQWDYVETMMKLSRQPWILNRSRGREFVSEWERLFYPVTDESGKVVEGSTVSIRRNTIKLTRKLKSTQRRLEKAMNEADGLRAKGAEVPKPLADRIESLKKNADELAARIEELKRPVEKRVPFFYGQAASDIVPPFNPWQLATLIRGKRALGAFDALKTTHIGGVLPSLDNIVSVFKFLAIWRYGFAFTASFIDEFWRLIPEGVFADILLSPFRRGELSHFAVRKMLKETGAMKYATRSTIADILRGSTRWASVAPEDDDYYLYINEAIDQSTDDPVAQWVRKYPREDGESMDEYRNRLAAHIIDELQDDTNEAVAARAFLEQHGRLPKGYASPEARERFLSEEQRALERELKDASQQYDKAEANLTSLQRKRDVAVAAIAKVKNPPADVKLKAATEYILKHPKDAKFLTSVSRGADITTHAKIAALTDRDGLARLLADDESVRRYFFEWARKNGYAEKKTGTGVLRARQVPDTKNAADLVRAMARNEKYALRSDPEWLLGKFYDEQGEASRKAVMRWRSRATSSLSDYANYEKSFIRRGLTSGERDAIAHYYGTMRYEGSKLNDALKAARKDVRAAERRLKKAKEAVPRKIGYEPEDVENFTRWLSQQVEFYSMFSEHPQLYDAFLNYGKLTKREWKAIRDELAAKGRTLPLIAGSPTIAKPASWLTPYGVLENFSSVLRKLAFTTAFKKEYTRMLAMKVNDDVAFGRALALATDAVERAMYTHNETYFDYLMRDILMFSPAYRQAFLYWSRTLGKNPLLATTIASKGTDYPHVSIGDYRQSVPLPLFMSGSPEEWVLPGFSPIVLIPLRTVNFATAWDYDEKGGKWYYDSRNAKLDDLFDKFPPLSFASRTMSPLGMIDDLLYAVAPQVNNGAPRTTRLGMILSSLGLSLRKDPSIRNRIAINIMQAQLARGLEPDYTKAISEMRKAPGWYRFLQALGIERPEGVFEAATRMFGLNKIYYDPETFQPAIEMDEDVWQKIVGDRPRTILQAQRALAEARKNGDTETIKWILSDPTMKAIDRFWQMDIEDRVQYLNTPQGIKILPYVTGKYFYKDGRPLLAGEFYDMLDKGRIYAKPLEEYAKSVEDNFKALGWTVTLRKHEKMTKEALKESKRNIAACIKELSGGDRDRAKQMWEDVRDWIKWGDGTITDEGWRRNGPPLWLKVWAEQRGLTPEQWDPVYIKARLEVFKMGSDRAGERAGEWEPSRPQGMRSRGIIDNWLNESLLRLWQTGGAYEDLKKAAKDKVSVQQAYRVGSTLARLLPQYDVLFNPNKSASYDYIKESLQRMNRQKIGAMRYFATAPYYSVWGNYTDLVIAAGGVPENEKKVVNSMMRIERAYSEYSKVLNDKNASYDEKRKAAVAFKAIRAEEMKKPWMAVFRDGPASRIYYIWTKEGMGVSKQYLKKVVRWMTGKGEPIYDNIVANFDAFPHNYQRFHTDDSRERLEARAAWASVCLAAMQFRRVNESLKNEAGWGMGYSPDAKALEPYLDRLYGLVDAWKKRSKKFAKEYEKMGGDYLIKDMLDLSK